MAMFISSVKPSFKFQQGFSLVEMLIVLLIVGVLAIGSIFGVAEFRSVEHVKEGEKKIYNLKAQLLSFAQVNKFLPCPDTDYDGYENRIGSVVCKSSVGTAPYIDLGLPRDGVQDAWSNFIRYAVNRQVNDPNFICDQAASASYFCRSGFNVNWFSVNLTPPLSGVGGVGNYYVCNRNPSYCNASSVATASNLEVESASVVLVAYNEDGQRTLDNCSASQGVSRENCDKNEFYHNGIKSLEGANFYDDVVLSISGYEIKKALLGEVIVWDSYPKGRGELVPTYEDYDITSGAVDGGGGGGVGDDLTEIETSGDDVILVRRNVDTALSLGAGNDHIVIGNDLNANATLTTGKGSDTVYIVGVAYSDVLLGDGNDTFVLSTNLTETLDAGLGNDKAWIQGDVELGAIFLLGDGDDVVWLGKNEKQENGTFIASGGGLGANVNGGDGYDILVLESMTQADWNAANGLSYITDFELIFFKQDEYTGAREHIVLQ
ncbi:MAG: prepilin-type N-terminal cleavage/methylation domain-containing protein [Thiomicrorhabdus sp.]|nr:prepilin-type N-terminal cleavage/methylation domain-containing protein [Thiomicrorhabdus sp.]